MLTLSHKPERRRCLIARKHVRPKRRAAVRLEQLCQYVAVIGFHREVDPLVQRRLFQSGPRSSNSATFDAASQDEYYGEPFGSFYSRIKGTNRTGATVVAVVDPSACFVNTMSS